MCTRKNEIAVFVSKIDMFSDTDFHRVEGKLCSLLKKQVTPISGSIDEEDKVMEFNGENLLVVIYIGRFANTVLKEEFAEEIKNGIVIVSTGEEDAHKKIREYFPDNRYEFLNEKIEFNPGFMQEMGGPNTPNNI